MMRRALLAVALVAALVVGWLVWSHQAPSREALCFARYSRMPTTCKAGDLIQPTSAADMLERCQLPVAPGDVAAGVCRYLGYTRERR